MACPCCLPRCSCDAIGKAAGSLSSVDYKFSSDRLNGYEVSGSLSIENPCSSSGTTKKIIQNAGKPDYPCKNAQYPRTDTAIVVVNSAFTYSCTKGPVLTIDLLEYLNSGGRPGGFSGFSGYCTPDYVFDGLHYVAEVDFSGRRYQPNPGFDSRWDFSDTVWSDFAFYLRPKLISSNFTTVNAKRGGLWGSLQYPSSLETEKTQYTIEFKTVYTKGFDFARPFYHGDGSVDYPYLYGYFNYSVSVTLHFNNLP